ncbi:hypothetical protein M3G03_10230 [Aestuariimicrobium sp. p3-SID1156]|uniref:hypothetical protein n=1 Tax=Aestuariimicrobium sp. p3-SID1156 TaxID=2916038 RepID=UPI00223B396C|nr:hypothetical protein [Aestuariimicrobium sp. p3-SID1156]MCT1459908.1 hypothetical protein [Aestuariimicrobium sp. p3-SID1156]
MNQSTIPQLAGRPDSSIEARIITTSPELAAEWLSRTVNNRNLDKAAVERYANDMSTGLWTFTGQPIIFNASGHLDDGQHRLSAQVRAGATIDWLVVGGVGRSAQNFMDIGKPRSVAGQLQISGHSLSHAVAAAARMELVYLGISNPSKPQVREFAESNFAELHAAGVVGRSVAQIIRGSSAAYSAAYFHMARIDLDLANEFFDKLRTGADLSETSPILVARNYIAKQGIARTMNDNQRSLFVDYLHKTWNLWVAGKGVKSFGVPTKRVELIDPARNGVQE